MREWPFAPTGRGLTPSAVRVFGGVSTAVVVCVLVVLLTACSGGDRNGTAMSRAAIAAEEIAAWRGADSLDARCAQLPDTMTEFSGAVLDSSTLPFGRLAIAPPCPRATVGYIAFANVERTYRFVAPANSWVVARARGAQTDLTLSIDSPLLSPVDSTRIGRLVADSVLLDRDREVIVRLMLVPRTKTAPRESAVLLSVVVRQQQ
jgi:hypothetical protein